MAWTLASSGSTVTIHPDDRQDIRQYGVNYSIQTVLDATKNVITYFGAESDRRQLMFILDETETAGGLEMLNSFRKTNADVTLTSDQGSQGTYRILSLKATRRQALNKASPVWECETELINSA